MGKTLDDICLEIYLGEFADFDPYDEPTVNNRLTQLMKVANEVNVGIWAKGWNREQALIGAGYDPEIIQTIADHEKMREYDYNGC